jgi:hypothetical protein
MSFSSSSGTFPNNSVVQNIPYIPSNTQIIPEASNVPFVQSYSSPHRNVPLASPHYDNQSVSYNHESLGSPTTETQEISNISSNPVNPVTFPAYPQDPYSQSSNLLPSQEVPDDQSKSQILSKASASLLSHNQSQNDFLNPRVNAFFNSIPPNQNPGEVFINSSLNSPGVKNDHPYRHAVEIDNQSFNKFYKTISKEENDLISSRLSVTQIPEHYVKLKLTPKVRSPNLKENYSEFILHDFFEVKDVDQPVETISNGWIRLDVMKKIAPFNADFIRCIDSLSSDFHIAGWKKSRGDGNCYYRAVITRYLEIVTNPYSVISNLKIFVLMIEKLQAFVKDRTEIDLNYRNALDYILCGCKNLEEQKNTPNEAFMTLMYWFQVHEFDINLVRVARLLTYQSLIEKADEYTDFGINIESISTLILLMGEEAEAFVLMLLPLHLGIKVVQYNLFKKVNMEIFPNQDEKIIEVHIVRRGGHYDILYTKQELERDMYRFSTGSYHFYNQ